MEEKAPAPQKRTPPEASTMRGSPVAQEVCAVLPRDRGRQGAQGAALVVATAALHLALQCALPRGRPQALGPAEERDATRSPLPQTL